MGCLAYDYDNLQCQSDSDSSSSVCLPVVWQLAVLQLHQWYVIIIVVIEVLDTFIRHHWISTLKAKVKLFNGNQTDWQNKFQKTDSGLRKAELSKKFKY